ncbi:MAG: hypothetical protein AAGJ35_04790, partial [Myxococcota bacterium]
RYAKLMGVFGLGVLLLLGVGWGALRFLQPHKVGHVVEMQEYVKHLPIQRAYQYQKTLSLLLDPVKQAIWDTESIRLQSMRLFPTLRKNKMKYLQVFSSKGESVGTLLFRLRVPDKPEKKASP